jgi:hypothetical protein
MTSLAHPSYFSAWIVILKSTHQKVIYKYINGHGLNVNILIIILKIYSCSSCSEYGPMDCSYVYGIELLGPIKC